ncbi:MAG: aminotransferase class IV, partial [Elusimicrobiota bacterium]
MRIKVTDHGFLYGFGLFETMRSFKGKIHLLSEHLKRIVASAHILGIPCPQASELERAVLHACKKSKYVHTYIRLNLWKSNGGGKYHVIFK